MMLRRTGKKGILISSFTEPSPLDIHAIDPRQIAKGGGALQADACESDDFQMRIPPRSFMLEGVDRV